VSALAGLSKRKKVQKNTQGEESGLECQAAGPAGPYPASQNRKSQISSDDRIRTQGFVLERRGGYIKGEEEGDSLFGLFSRGWILLIHGGEDTKMMEEGLGGTSVLSSYLRCDGVFGG